MSSPFDAQDRTAQPAAHRPRRPLAAMLSLGLVAMLAFAPSAAAGTNITITDFQFTPAKLFTTQNTIVTWLNDSGGSFTHSVTPGANTADTAFDWPPTHDLADSSHYDRKFKMAGTFIYHCRFHSSMVGKVKIALQVEHSGRDFTIIAAPAPLPAANPFTLQIQRRLPGQGQWVTLSNSHANVAMFHGATAGTYSFRSRVIRTSNGASSLWSKIVMVAVS